MRHARRRAPDGFFHRLSLQLPLLPLFHTSFPLVHHCLHHPRAPPSRNTLNYGCALRSSLSAKDCSDGQRSHTHTTHTHQHTSKAAGTHRRILPSFPRPLLCAISLTTSPPAALLRRHRQATAAPSSKNQVAVRQRTAAYTSLVPSSLTFLFAFLFSSSAHTHTHTHHTTQLEHVFSRLARTAAKAPPQRVAALPEPCASVCV